MQFRWSALIKIDLCRTPHQYACIYILVSWNRRNHSFMYPNAPLNLIFFFLPLVLNVAVILLFLPLAQSHCVRAWWHGELSMTFLLHRVEGLPWASAVDNNRRDGGSTVWVVGCELGAKLSAHAWGRTPLLLQVLASPSGIWHHCFLTRLKIQISSSSSCRTCVSFSKCTACWVARDAQDL